ncbi:putative peptide zinc metalloprotease protein [Geodermatophilus tzadiensis]|uniref:Putative peptide zinc metalloprotease protein n=1 Tax=Geodermatophilus tzadiensis TaxID=1137988 RepID=A0A2T0TYD6_9ACTN|nr:hypothetical protein [Geodermatophilus tzadiensis]PRY50684.1 putative peptide zinc metalloprotease protein [Geodermatophilus tzadiensis]
MAQVLAPATENGHRLYGLTAGTELLGEYQDSAYQEPKYLIQRVDGQTMQLPRLLYGVACALDGRDARRIAETVNAELGQELTEDDVRFLVEERLYPAGIVAVSTEGPDSGTLPDAGALPDSGTPVDGRSPDGAAGGAQPVGSAPVPMPVRNDLLLALRYRAGVIPAGVADRIGRVLQPLFARPVWTVLVAAFVAVDVTIIAGGDLLAQSVAGVQAVVERPSLLLVVLGITVVTGAIHEFGHVTACRYGGARPGNVGVGIYIVWPALYSDVTDSYRLGRVGRLRTDLGGVYFDAISLAVLGLVYLRTGEPWLLLALVGMHVETAWQFLPSIRLDGYYILADLVGVPDLFGYVKPALLSAIPGRPVHPRVAELKPRARRTVVLWVLLVVPTLVLWLVLFLLAAPRLIPAAWRSLQDYLQGLDAAVRGGDVVTTSLGVFQVLLLALPWVGTVLILWMLVDVVRQKRRARGAASRISPDTAATLRRVAALVAVAAAGCALIARVAAVAATRPATAEETALADAALATVHGVTGPPVGAGEWLAHAQLTLYATVSGAFEEATPVAAARELSVLATAVLVACLVGLVLQHRLRPLAVVLPLAAVAAMGPAVSELAAAGPAVLGAAWTALGLVVLGRARHLATRGAGVLAVVVGVVTEPLVAVPFAVGAAVVLAAGSRPWSRLPWWPVREDAVAGRHSRLPATAPRHRRPDDVRRTALRWSAAALLLAVVGIVAAVVPAGRVGRPLDPAERTVLVLVAAIVVVTALAVRRMRVPAAGTGALLVLAVLPWEGAGSAAVLGVVATVVLTAVLVDGVVRVPVPQRPHPLLRGLAVVPAVVLVVVGVLFQPGQAVPLPHAALADWLRGPEAGQGTVSVPAPLWGDLVSDGVAPDRLARAGSGAAATAEWTVEVGVPPAVGTPQVRFGTGPSALVVTRSAHAEEREREAEAEGAARAAAAQEAAAAAFAARQAYGGSLAGNPRLEAPDEVRAALRDGAVDEQVLGALAALTAGHDLTLAPGPGWAGPDAGTPYLDIEITRLDGLSTGSPAVVTALRDLLTALPPRYVPAEIGQEPECLVLTWAPEPAADTPSSARDPE